eukprot:12890796-Prorocentrum_lima.AAC.1
MHEGIAPGGVLDGEPLQQLKQAVAKLTERAARLDGGKEVIDIQEEIWALHDQLHPGEWQPTQYVMTSPAASTPKVLSEQQESPNLTGEV